MTLSCLLKKWKQSEVEWLLFPLAMNDHLSLSSMCLAITRIIVGLTFHTVASPLDKKMYVPYEGLFNPCPPLGEEIISVFAVTLYKEKYLLGFFFFSAI